MSWIFSALRAASLLAIISLAAVGAGSIIGFYGLMFGFVSMEEFAVVVDRAGEWHTTMLGGFAATVGGVFARYGGPAAWNSLLNEIARRIGETRFDSEPSAPGLGIRRGNR